MAALTVQTLSRSGIVPSYASAGGSGDTATWAKDLFLHVKNGSGSSINVTISSQYDTAPIGTTADDLVVAVGAGAEKMIGPFYEAAYKNSDGNIEIAYSATTTVTVGAFEL